MKRFEAPTAERQKARREEQDYAAVRRNVEEFLSPRRHGRRIWSWNDPWDKLFAAICVFPWVFAETSDIMKIQTILKEANPMTRGEALPLFFTVLSTI